MNGGHFEKGGQLENLKIDRPSPYGDLFLCQVWLSYLSWCLRNRADKVASKRRIKIIIIIIIRNGAKTISLRHFVFGDLITIRRRNGATKRS